jgi:hypothetical protein
MLIHANHRWPKVVTANLWPYALQMANDVLCGMPNMQHPQHLTLQQVFSNTKFNPNPKHWKPFACPVYVLDNTLQSGTRIFHKWKQRSRVGIYLGQSPQHTRSVALFLDWKTVLVSPQFHIKTGFVVFKEAKKPQTVETAVPIIRQQNDRWKAPT